MTKEYVEQVGRLAYFWAWPMVNVYNRVVAFSQLPEPGLIGGIVPAAPPNQLSMLTDYIVPEERVVACPNQDVVYGFSVLSLDREPVIIQVPDFGDRFWVYQVVDERTDSFANLGKMYGTKPGLYLLAGPDWKEETPPGIQGIFRSTTNLGVVIPRVFKDATEEDTKAVQPLLNQIMIYPLSQSDGTIKTKDWSTNRKYPSTSEGQGETKWVVPEKFVDQLPKVIDDLSPLPGEEAMYANIRAVWAAAEKDPNLKQALQQAAIAAEKELVSPVFEFRNFGIPVAGNWTTQVNGAKFGTDYFTRTAVAKSNIFVNKPEETKYFYLDLDSSAGRLNGNNHYTVTFPKDGLPPVKGFWSLTLYNKFHFFEPNKLKRYSLGTKNKDLQFDPDGSLTLYVSATPPDDSSKMSNWLPAPKDDFSLFSRCYWPEEVITEGKWTPPPAVKELSPQEKGNVLAASRDVLANAEFKNDFPTTDSAEMLRDELFFQRAVQVYLWSIPAVNLYAMKEGSEKVYGGGYNVLPVWKERLNAQTRVTTPNSDCLYAMGYINIGKDGPIVVEVPPRMQGIFDDFFQRPLQGPTINGVTYSGDVGFPGPDAGNGGKYLIVPTSYQGEIPDGYYVFRSRTNNVLVFYRAFFTDPNDLEAPNKAIASTRIYPLKKKESAAEMKFPDGSKTPADMLFPHDGSYFDMLARFVDEETVDPADIDWRGMMAAIGIAKGQPFQPNARQRELLDKAGKTAFKMSKVVIYEGLVDQPGGKYYPDRQWENVFAGQNPEFQASGTFTNQDQRIAYFTSAYATSPGMVKNMLEKGAKYPSTWRDADGNYLAGDNSYSLHLPPNIPAANFWSLTVYDSIGASGLQNGQSFPSLNSMDKPVPNGDGSYDIYFGPTAPSGKEKNWLRTVPGKGYFIIFRLYSPKHAFFDQSWKPDDLKRTK